jgi:HSP20 family molecular chaperone IbpA
MNRSSGPRPSWVPNADVFIAPSGALILCFELSGIEPGDVKINTEGNRLRVTGERPSSGVATAHTVLVHEINAGPFESFLDLPPGYDLPRASSAFVNGTLRITVPPVPKA